MLVIQEQLTALKTIQIFAEQVDDFVPVVRAHAGGVWSDNDVRKGPQDAACIQGFVVKDVQHGASELAVLQRGDHGGFIDDPATSNVDENRATIEKRDLPGTDQAIRFGNGRRREHQHVASAESIRQLVRAGDAIDERRRNLGQAAANSGHLHAECVRAARDFLSDRPETDDRHPPALQTPRPRAVR